MTSKRGKAKVLLYLHALSGGGAERAMALLASGLSQRGHDVVLAVDYAASDNETYLDAIVRRETLGSNHFVSVAKLAGLLAREKPDVSVSALCGSNLKHFLAAGLVGRLDRAILSYHGFYQSEPQLLSRASYLLTPLLTRAASGTLAVSSALRTNLIQQWHASKARTHLIYNPVTWKPRPSSITAEMLKNRPATVLASGRLIPLKNFDGLIRAFAHVSPPSARLIILGDGPERPRLEAEIAKLGLRGRIDLPGYIRDPWDYYAQASCFVVSSRSESFGMTVVEALANGLPVVSTDCGGPAEILSGGKDGTIVPIDDEKALAGAITAALADPGSPSSRMQRAERFAFPRAIDAYESLIEEIAGRARSPVPIGEPA